MSRLEVRHRGTGASGVRGPTNRRTRRARIRFLGDMTHRRFTYFSATASQGSCWTVFRWRGRVSEKSGVGTAVAVFVALVTLPQDKEGAGSQRSRRGRTRGRSSAPWGHISSASRLRRSVFANKRFARSLPTTVSSSDPSGPAILSQGIVTFRGCLLLVGHWFFVVLLAVG